MTVTNASFSAFVHDLQSYVEANGKMPSNRSNASPFEKVLAASVEYWRGVLKSPDKGLLDSKEMAALETIPGWVRRRRGGRQAIPAGQRSRELDAFVEVNGHMPRAGSQSAEERSLAGWMSRVRDEYRRGELDDNVVKQLEAVPGWSWGRGVEGWEDTFHDLQVFVDATGSMPTNQGTSVKEKQLAYWVDIQRRRYKGTRAPNLTTQQREMLESLSGWVGA